jgi:hypothetical protein
MQMRVPESVNVQAVLDAAPELFVDAAGEPRIGLPIPRDDPKHAVTIWPLRDIRVRSEIAEFLFREKGRVLSESEITRILNVLEGKAWKDHRIDIELKQALDEEPLIEAVFIFLHQPETAGQFRGSCSKLLPALTKIGRKSGVDTRSRAWPKGAAQLSNRLGQLEAMLQKCGVSMRRGRMPGGARYVNLVSNFSRDDGAKTASQTPSLDNDHHPNKLCTTDACDAASEGIFDRIQLSE